MNDQTIIELIRTGKNDKALNALYKNFPATRKLIKSKGGNQQDAQDVFQDALIILIKKIRDNKFILTAQLSTYLFSVCRFLWKDELKKRNNHSHTTVEIDLTQLEIEELDDAVKRESLAKLAEKALAGLKERCRELLLLFYEGRLKLKEIALHMGYSSENTAKNQKYKCIENAKLRLKELQQTFENF